ncbi:MAG: putative sugar nucleotidyl transferase [Rubricoccaceae bacterium]|nr:putative sugar nucleotidyl transferase [Rubricoccaceae bacterium]
MHLCLFEDANVPHLYPLVLTRTAGDLRVGARTLIERQKGAFPHAGWSISARKEVADVTAQEHPDALVNKLPNDGQGVLFVNQCWLVRGGEFLEAVHAAVGSSNPKAWALGDTLVAGWHPSPPTDATSRPIAELFENPVVIGESEATLISRLWHLVGDIDGRIERDLLDSEGLGQHGGTIHSSVILAHPEHIHVAHDATIRPGAILNAEDGPIHVGSEAVVEEGTILRGPVYLGPRSVVHAGTRLQVVSAGPFCKLGGEIQGSIIHSYSNKAHDGYLGDSYLGRWCNLGADTNTSNLKNDYSEVTLYDAVERDFLRTGSQFIGLVMGDHSKCSINTMFNTGTVVGVFCNLFGSGFPPRYLPSFSWGAADTPYKLDKALQVAEAVMARRGMKLTKAESALLTRLYAGEYSEKRL